MDLRKLVNSDTSTTQLESNRGSFARRDERVNEAAQPYTNDAGAFHQGNGAAPANGRSSHSYGALSPPAIVMPPSSAYVQHPPYQQAYQQSPVSLSPYQAQQPMSYPNPNGHSSRPPSHGYDRSPVTPQHSLQQAISPSPSQHSHTSQSARQSPLPALQYGLQPQAIRVGSGGPTSQHPYVDQRQYEPQPLGPPPHRKSMEHTATSHAPSRGSRDDRKQSESVSPKTLPRTDLSYDSSQSTLQEDGTSISPQHLATQTQRVPSTTINTSSVTPERPHIRRSETMEMSNLLTPVTETTTEPSFGSATRTAIIAAEKQGMPAHATTAAEPYAEPSDRRKRALEDESTVMPPAKKEKISTESRITTEPIAAAAKPSVKRTTQIPPWAIYSAKNLKMKAGQMMYQGATAIASAKPSEHHEKQPQSNSSRLGMIAQAAQGPNLEQPWRDPLPYDTDLIKARKILGTWEKTFVWNTPLPDMLRTLQEWFFRNVQQYGSLVQDASGTLEIEAKLGRLMDNNRQQPADLPIMNMAIIRPSAHRDYRFESALLLEDFKKVNEYLNHALVQSSQPDRETMKHTRVLEEDSFAELSSVGRARVPKALLQVVPPGRILRLRTTRDIKSGNITAHIVKVPIADLHVFNPAGYDCRISMNAEINMMHDGLHFEDLIEPNSPAQPSRRKDRLSYKHLAYQIDITSVTVQGQASYEMELEVDAQVLSKQIKLITENKQHAFGDVVSGFLDNATYLMRLG